MIGAIAGDMIGSLYEKYPIKTKDFGGRAGKNQCVVVWVPFPDGAAAYQLGEIQPLAVRLQLEFRPEPESRGADALSRDAHQSQFV